MSEATATRFVEPAPAVAMRGIVKRFGSLVALDGVDLDVRSGEIHALLGENGAGKTTLMNVLFGLLQPDAGEIALNGTIVRLRDPHDAVARGIGMVHQHFKLVPTLTVAENVLLGDRGGVAITRKTIAKVSERLRECSEHYGLGIEPSAHVWRLSVGEQQRAEILRALYRQASVLVLDEPTATLTPFEAAELLPRLRVMAAEGTGVVLITHHLDEVITHTDRITVLRAGRTIATLRPAETSAGELARLMVGREVSSTAVGIGVSDEERRAGTGAIRAAAPVLRIRGLRARGSTGVETLHGVDLAVHASEIVAVAGVEGNGQAELEEVLFGLRAVTEGTVELDGREITGLAPGRLLDAGVGIVPSDRYRRGIVRALSIGENLVLDRIGDPPYGGLLTVRRRAIAANAREQIERFSIRASRPDVPAGTLSGGNAQRVVLARALSRDLKALIAAQPSRGLDVGAIEFVWSQLEAVRARGVAVLLFSTDLEEVFALADRCVVMFRGQIVAEYDRSDLSRERIGLAMGGVVEPELLPSQASTGPEANR